MNKINIIISVTFLSFASSTVMSAENKACLIEGSYTLMGKTTEIKDCMQNNGIPHKFFIESCKSLANAGEALGFPPSKLTYMEKCPATPQGVCNNMGGGQLAGYYYKREDIAGTKSSCIAAGGRWSER